MTSMAMDPGATPERRCNNRLGKKRMNDVARRKADNFGPPRDFYGYGPNPPYADWPGDARIAVNFNLNFEAGGER